MPTARASIHIEAASEEVFDFVNIPWRIPEYVSLVLDILEVSEGPVGVGTKILERAKPGPVTVTTLWEVITYERPRLSVWRSRQSDMDMTLTKQIRPDGEGAYYEQWLEYRFMPRIRPVGWLLEKAFVHRNIQGSFDEVVKGIKRIVENERRAATDKI